MTRNQPSRFRRNILLGISLLWLCCGSQQHLRAQTLPMKLLEDSSKIVFLGDSVTYAGHYVAQFDLWLEAQQLESNPTVLNLGLPSETVSGLSEDGHAGGRFARPDLDERLDRVLEQTNPDLIIACYGINCGIYQPFDESRFQKYQEGIQNLVDKAAFAGVELILLTPLPYDDSQSRLDFSYDDVMRKYAEWLVAEGEREDWHVIDLHSAFNAELRSLRARIPNFTFQRDAVHPNRAGHNLMGQVLLRSFEEDYNTPRVTGIDAVVARTKNMHILRDAWLDKIGHTRPGLSKGLTVEEAELRYNSLTQMSKTIRKIQEKLAEDNAGQDK